MKTTPARAIAIGTLVYVLLLCIIYISGQDPHPTGINQGSWIEALASLLAWFLPALIAGSVATKRPMIVGLLLGLSMVLFEFVASIIVFGWEWAVAALRILPGSEVFFILSAVAFAYAGWKLRECTNQESKHYFS